MFLLAVLIKRMLTCSTQNYADSNQFLDGAFSSSESDSRPEQYQQHQQHQQKLKQKKISNLPMLPHTIIVRYFRSTGVLNASAHNNDMANVEWCK